MPLVKLLIECVNIPTKSTLCVSRAGQYPILRQQHSQGPVLREWPNKQYKELVFEDYCIETNIANQGVLVKPNLLGRVINIVKYEDDCDIIIVYKEYKKYEDLYSYPVSSQTLGIYFVSNISSELKSCSIYSASIYFCHLEMVQLHSPFSIQTEHPQHKHYVLEIFL